MIDASEQDDEREPTMEEILASIRRIISVDEEEGGDAEGDEEEVAEAEEPAEEPEEDPAPEDDDEVLELTEVVADIDDVPELEPELDPSMEDEAEEEEKPVPVEDLDSIELQEPAPAPAPALQPVAAAPAADLHALLSDHAAVATTGTLAGLSGAVTAARDMPMGYAHQTLEDLVKSLLRPMLKEWLDENLPPLVERLVEKEIAKLVGRAENG